MGVGGEIRFEEVEIASLVGVVDNDES